MRFLDLLFTLLSLPVAVLAGYLGLLAIAAGKRPPAAASPLTYRFDLIVPAHNESLGIAATVASLLALDYPAEQRAVWVVADNCEDDTAAQARAAGANVLERNHAQLRGKGHALELAFAQSAERGFAEAVVVIDADTTVSPNLLKAFASRMAQGALAMQASYGVRNPEASWRTRLMRIALALFNDLRSLGRDRLGWSTGLRGNGMCFTHGLLREVPHQSYSLVEDLEYGIRLGKAGHRVHCVEEAQVKGEMVSGEKASRSQRQRWEGGRRQLARAQARPLLREALRRRSGLLLDLALDLLTPPLATLAAAAFALSVLLAGVAAHSGSLGWVSLWTIAFADVALVVYVLRGWALSGVGPRGLLDLMWTPVYIIWKMGLVFRRPGKKSGEPEWVRTRREEEPRSP